jgi:hypothetical protein
MRKLAVLVPWSSPFFWTVTAFNLMNLKHPEGWEVRFIAGEGFCPANRHNACIIRALNWGAHAMCFMGPDHWVETDTLVKLIGHLDDGWDMACGWVPSRGAKIGPNDIAYPRIAYKKKDPDTLPSVRIPVLHHNDNEWDIITTGAESQEIHIIGSGILMFKVEVVADMKRPWFSEFIARDELYSRFPVQDSHFVYRCTIVGGNRLWLDTTIEAYHLDVFPIDDNYMEMYKDIDEHPIRKLKAPEDERGGWDATAEPVYTGKDILSGGKV